MSSMNPQKALCANFLNCVLHLLNWITERKLIDFNSTKDLMCTLQVFISGEMLLMKSCNFAHKAFCRFIHDISFYQKKMRQLDNASQLLTPNKSEDFDLVHSFCHGTLLNIKDFVQVLYAKWEWRLGPET